MVRRAWARAAASPVSRSFRSSESILARSEEHTSELQSQSNLVCRLLLEKKKIQMLDEWLARFGFRQLSKFENVFQRHLIENKRGSKQSKPRAAQPAPMLSRFAL